MTCVPLDAKAEGSHKDEGGGREQVWRRHERGESEVKTAMCYVKKIQLKDGFRFN